MKVQDVKSASSMFSICDSAKNTKYVYVRIQAKCVVVMNSPPPLFIKDFFFWDMNNLRHV